MSSHICTSWLPLDYLTLQPRGPLYTAFICLMLVHPTHEQQEANKLCKALEHEHGTPRSSQVHADASSFTARDLQLAGGSAVLAIHPVIYSPAESYVSQHVMAKYSQHLWQMWHCSICVLLQRTYMCNSSCYRGIP